MNKKTLFPLVMMLSIRFGSCSNDIVFLSSDIDSLIDYYALMTYIGRYEGWNLEYNYGLWRLSNLGDGEYEDTKWRWVVFDLNSFTYERPEYNTILDICEKDCVFNPLYKNNSFKTLFLNRVREIGETCLEKESVLSFIDAYRTSYSQQAYLEGVRFYDDGNNGLETLNETIDGVRDFFDKRHGYITDIIANEMSS